MFGWRKKKEKGEEEMTTLEQVRKAYEDLSEDDKKSFHQSLADRVHESIAAQERADGNEDSQTAADREHEALGAEHAAGHGDVAELHMEDREEKREDDREDRQEERAEERHEEAEDWRSALDARLSRIEELLTKKESGDAAALENAKKVYGLHSGVFESAAKKEDGITPKEAAEMVRKIRG